MQRKQRLSLEIGEKGYFLSVKNKKGDQLPYVQLEDFLIRSGRVEWTLKTSAGHIISGTVKDKQTNPLFHGGWVALAIPVTLHTKRSLAPDFIFQLPGIVTITNNPWV